MAIQPIAIFPSVHAELKRSTLSFVDMVTCWLWPRISTTFRPRAFYAQCPVGAHRPLHRSLRHHRGYRACAVVQAASQTKNRARSARAVMTSFLKYCILIMCNIDVTSLTLQCSNFLPYDFYSAKIEAFNVGLGAK